MTDLTRAASDVIAERRRQVTEERYDVAHDDAEPPGTLVWAAAAYCQSAIGAADASLALWPWELKFWKPRSTREDLVRAGALILAEIERIDRQWTGE